MLTKVDKEKVLTTEDTKSYVYRRRFTGLLQCVESRGMLENAMLCLRDNQILEKGRKLFPALLEGSHEMCASTHI